MGFVAAGVVEPTVIEPCIQKDQADCGVACLAMLLGLPYQQVRDVAPSTVGHAGMSNRQLRTTARHLGHRLRYHSKIDDDDIGILDLQRPVNALRPAGEWEGHYVLFVRGVIVNPADGTLWTDPAAFCSTRRWEIVGLFSRRE